MVNFMREDVEVATHADLPPLQRLYPVPKVDPALQRGLIASFGVKLEHEVRRAQQEGAVPPDEQLALLPTFQTAAQEDSDYIHREAAEAARRAEASRLADEQRRLRAAEEAAAAATRKAEEKQLRREQRIQSKREARARAYAEEQRRYEDLLGRWQATIEERKAKVQETQTALEVAERRKETLEARQQELTERKSKLLSQLRELAAKSEQQGNGNDAGSVPETLVGLSHHHSRRPSSPKPIETRSPRRHSPVTNQQCPASERHNSPPERGSRRPVPRSPTRPWRPNHAPRPLYLESGSPHFEGPREYLPPSSRSYMPLGARHHGLDRPREPWNERRERSPPPYFGPRERRSPPPQKGPMPLQHGSGRGSPPPSLRRYRDEEPRWQHRSPNLGGRDRSPGHGPGRDFMPHGGEYPRRPPKYEERERVGVHGRGRGGLPWDGPPRQWGRGGGRPSEGPWPG